MSYRRCEQCLTTTNKLRDDRPRDDYRMDDYDRRGGGGGRRDDRGRDDFRRDDFRGERRGGRGGFRGGGGGFRGGRDGRDRDRGGMSMFHMFTLSYTKNVNGQGPEITKEIKRRETTTEEDVLEVCPGRLLQSQ